MLRVVPHKVCVGKYVCTYTRKLSRESVIASVCHKQVRSDAASSSVDLVGRLGSPECQGAVLCFWAA